MLRPLLVASVLALALAASAIAQDKSKDDLPPPAATSPAPGAPQQGGIQGQNIFDVKPEVKPDASSDPKYMSQSNGERNRVQPGNNAPMWRGVAGGMEGFSSLPKSEHPEAGVLIQAPVQYPGSRLTTAGEAWRQVRNVWLIPYGGALFLIVLGALAIFYFTKGPIGEHDAHEGSRRIERFTPFERSTHWANAIAFCVLAISGIVMAFGKFFMLPVIGGALFGWLTWLLKTMHNFAGPLFAVSLVIMFFTFLRDNWPERGDMAWILKGGGMFGKAGEHPPPANRYNPGEKFVFWIGVLLLGSFVVASGLVMDKLIPGIVYDRATMQVAHMSHYVSTILMMCLFAGHIYLGTVGTRGAYKAMRTGYVGDEWAREHHGRWYEDIKSGKVPAQRSQPLVAADATILGEQRA
ncbi:MAG: putative formate dehydrogenase subunit precursor [Ramlibacter sp.]|jgi:formate dehydrogenase subunit gamma|nr:putative formate dehydrogenase subunit precursor [Ramlibacter sp.]